MSQMIFEQTLLTLPAKPRGFHLIDAEIERQLQLWPCVKVGTLQLFIQHSSASLTVNENADPTVRLDFEQVFNRLVPENAPYYLHTQEGPDDLPAHIKASLLGCSLVLPITNGQLNLGVWQGIYLGEHRDNASARKIVLTLVGR